MKHKIELYIFLILYFGIIIISAYFLANGEDCSEYTEKDYKNYYVTKECYEKWKNQ